MPARARDDLVDLGDGVWAAVGTFRVAALVWLAVTTALSFNSFDEPLGAVIGVGAAAVVTLAQRRPPDAWRRWLLAAELVVGAGLIFADPWVYDEGRVVSFGGVWPIAGVLAAAALGGSRLGVGAGLVLGGARIVSEATWGELDWSTGQLLAVSATGALLALAGWAAGWAAQTLRSAEDRAARVAARDAVAAELHDGVLQTLAVIQRRSDDADLVALARSQEADLRRFLSDQTAGDGDGENRDLLEVLRTAAATASRRFGVRCEVAAVPPLPTIGAELADAVEGAVGECLANVAKHAGEDRAVIFAESDGASIVVSVSDRGRGFDVEAATMRGLEGSVGARVAAHAGSHRVRSEPGRGTTVELHLPLEPSGGRR